MKNSGSLGCKFRVGGASVMDMTNEPLGRVTIDNNYDIRAIVAVALCAEKDESLSPFHTVRFSARNERLEALATNKYIATWTTVDYNKPQSYGLEDFCVQVPARELRKLKTAKRLVIFGDPANWNLKVDDGPVIDGANDGRRFPAVEQILKDETKLASAPVLINSEWLGLLDKMSSTLKGVVNVNENVVSKESNYKPCLDTHIWDMAIPDCNKKLVATYGPLTAVIQTANRTTKKAPLKSETFGTMSWTKE